ncbi:MAG: fumarylacetoacetate hydrolase family protein [Candidatus Kapabacteria bacterium]|nr:fumarylacetoacetate hydrolase family protein [Candidatus Kapabacteria bacterium]MDW8225379.1 fumarylacetoacetate hydrolase family protein [Bacteroidota bacterium]
MRLVSYRLGRCVRAALVSQEDWVVDVAAACEFAQRRAALRCSLLLPPTMLQLLEQWEVAYTELRRLQEWCAGREELLHSEGIAFSMKEVVLEAPLQPRSVRDGYAFRQHVESARRSRGLPMIPEYDLFPVFYFSNHQAVTGPGPVFVQHHHLERLDFELECAVVIGRAAKNLPASLADRCIAGFMVMNDWSARELQSQEMKLNLGPAKGKDFATSLGPYLVTPDELADRTILTPEGNQYDLQMTARLNGEQISQDTLRNMTWTFAQILERASYGVWLYPGDVIGSGTCGTGCLLELNGTGIFSPPRWLRSGDTVELTIERLGTLRNTVVLAEGESVVL